MSSDPYVFVSVGEEHHKTKTVKNTVDPYWDETFHFNVKHPTSNSLLCCIYDWDRFSNDDSIGIISLPLYNLPRGREVVQWFTLRGVRKGEIQLAITAEDFGLELVQVVQQTQPVQYAPPPAQYAPQPVQYAPQPVQCYVPTTAPVPEIYRPPPPAKKRQTTFKKPDGITDEELGNIKEAFKNFDTDGSGYLTKPELKLLLHVTIAKKQSESILSRFVDGQFDNIDSDKSGYIDFNEFLVLYAKLKSGKY